MLEAESGTVESRRPRFQNVEAAIRWGFWELNQVQKKLAEDSVELETLLEQVHSVDQVVDQIIMKANEKSTERPMKKVQKGLWK